MYYTGTNLITMPRCGVFQFKDMLNNVINNA